MWTAIFAVALRGLLGDRCLAQGSHLNRSIEGGREHWSFTPPTYNPCQYRDSNPRPLGYKSDSLTIRSWLPPKKTLPFKKYIMLTKVAFVWNKWINKWTVVEYILKWNLLLWWWSWFLWLGNISHAICMRISSVKPVPWLAVNLHYLFSNGAAFNTQSHRSLTSEAISRSFSKAIHLRFWTRYCVACQIYLYRPALFFSSLQYNKAL